MAGDLESPFGAGAVEADGGPGDERPAPGLGDRFGQQARRVDAAGVQRVLLARTPSAVEQVFAGQMHDRVAGRDSRPDRLRRPGDVARGATAHDGDRVTCTHEPSPESRPDEPGAAGE